MLLAYANSLYLMNEMLRWTFMFLQTDAWETETEKKNVSSHRYGGIGCEQAIEFMWIVEGK